MARKKKIPNKEDYQKSNARAEVLDSASENESSPSPSSNKRSRLANDESNSHHYNEIENENDVDLNDESPIRPKRRRTCTETNTSRANDIATVTQVPYRHALPSIESNSLRRSNRGTVPKNGPQAYNKRWHPIDDLKPSKSDGKTTLQKRAKSLNLRGSKRSTSFTPETSNERMVDQPPVDHDETSLCPPRRRSSRNVYNADVAMKYDMSSHWSYRKLKEPQAFVKKLEEKRRSLDSRSARVEAADTKPESPPLVNLRKLNKHQQGNIRQPRSEVEAKGDASEDGSFISTRSENGQIRELQNLSFSPDALPPVESPAAELPMDLDEDLVLYEQNIDELPGSADPTTLPRRTPDTPFVRPFPIRNSPEENSQPLDWNDLTEFDRRLYSLQKGAPGKGDTVPLQWPAVKQVLIEEGWKEPLGSKSNKQDTRYIENRYEIIRLGVEAFFNAKSEPENKKAWTLFRVEGFDVYKMKKGRKYWRQSGESIVEPIETVLEHEFPCPQPSIAATDREESNGSIRDHLVAKQPDVIIDISSQVASATDTQIDKFLALAEPYEEVTSLLPPRTPKEDIVSSTTMRDDVEHLPNAVGNDQAIHEQSERTLMDVMRATQPNSSHATPAINMADIEALLEEVRSTQEISPKPLPRLSKYANGTTSPPKRKKRNTNEESFDIFEDETADGDAAKADKNTGHSEGGRRARDLDLPVENMNAGELVPGSQEGTAARTPRRSHYQLASISLGRPYTPPVWVDGAEHASIFGGPHP